MKKGGRYVLVFCAVALSLLMISSATAVPQVQSKSLINMVENVEQNRAVIGKRIHSLIYKDGLENDITFSKLEKFLKGNLVQNTLCNNKFNEIYNSNEIQSVINSKNFKEFLNSEETQKFIDSLDLEGCAAPTAIIGAILGLVIGLITWIPVAIISILFSPLFGLLAGLLALAAGQPQFILWFIVGMMIAIGTGIFWPFILVQEGLFGPF